MRNSRILLMCSGVLCPVLGCAAVDDGAQLGLVNVGKELFDIRAYVESAETALLKLDAEVAAVKTSVGTIAGDVSAVKVSVGSEGPTTWILAGGGVVLFGLVLWRLVRPATRMAGAAMKAAFNVE